jgi:hypothetical protein
MRYCREFMLPKVLAVAGGGNALFAPRGQAMLNVSE